METIQQRRFNDTLTKHLHVRIPTELHEGLNKLAVQEKKSVSLFVTELLQKTIKDTNTENQNSEQEEQSLLSSYRELSETRKQEAINFIESLVEEESNEDIKDALLQSGKELLNWELGKLQLRSLDELLAEISE